MPLMTEDNRPVSILNLPKRIEQALEDFGVLTVGDVIESLRSREKIPGIGSEGTGILADAVAPILCRKVHGNEGLTPVVAPGSIRFARSGRKIIEAPLDWIEDNGGETGLIHRRIRTQEMGIQTIYGIGSQYTKSDGDVSQAAKSIRVYCYLYLE